jgi:molecular chaperone DnaK
MNDPIVGIDLGTTNSEIAAYVGSDVELISSEGKKILPSCVALSPDGGLLVGEAARNQMLIYPERTARSRLLRDCSA